MRFEALQLLTNIYTINNNSVCLNIYTKLIKIFDFATLLLSPGKHTNTIVYMKNVNKNLFKHKSIFILIFSLFFSSV